MNHELRPKKAWQIFSIITLLFVVPVILAGLFYTHTTWLPKRSLNHGKLLAPPLALRQLAIDPAALQHKWGLVYVHSGVCDSFCQQGLYNMRQIQRALGKDTQRLQRILLTVQPGPADPPLQKLLDDSQTLFWRVDAVVLNQVLGRPAAFYVIDPLGNIILAYSASDNPEWMLDDLKYLMGVSSIG